MIDILNKIDLINKSSKRHIYTAQVFSPSLVDFVTWDGMQYDRLDKMTTSIIKSIKESCPELTYDEVLDLYNKLVTKGEIAVYDIDLQRLVIDTVSTEDLTL